MSLFSKPKVPVAPPPPAPPPPAPTPTDPESVAARVRQERETAARKGRNSTILTGPTGLQPVFSQGSTLLGS